MDNFNPFTDCSFQVKMIFVHAIYLFVRFGVPSRKPGPPPFLSMNSTPS